MIRKLIQISFLLLSVLGLVTVNYTMFIIFLISSLLFGSFFCGWLCPFGFAQDLISKISKMLKIPQIVVPKKIERIIKFSRYILFIFVFFGFSFALLLDSPYMVFSGVLSWNYKFISIASWVVFAFILIMGLFIDRPFCRYLCTEGARYGALSILRIFTIKRNDSNCINCNKCDKNCPVNINISTIENVRDPQCINCLECIKNCPVDGCLSYSFVLKKKEIK